MKFVDLDGWLAVEGDWNVMWTEPVAYRHFWSTGVRAVTYPEMVGVEIVREVQFPSPAWKLGDGREIQMPNEGRMNSLKREEKPIRRPSPKRKWVDGKWR